MDKKIRLAAVKERTPRLIEALTAVWEHSVRATHHFLSESEILRIRAYVPQAVGGVAQLVAAENQAGEPVQGHIESLLARFIIENSPEEGSTLTVDADEKGSFIIGQKQ